LGYGGTDIHSFYNPTHRIRLVGRDGALSLNYA